MTYLKGTYTWCEANETVQSVLFGRVVCSKLQKAVKVRDYITEASKQMIDRRRTRVRKLLNTLYVMTESCHLTLDGENIVILSGEKTLGKYHMFYIYMRYAISSLNMAEYIASLTTVSTPHHGSLTVDRLLQLPDFLIRFAAGCWDLWLRVCGDKSPDAYEVFKTFTTAAAEEFNRKNPDAPGVYYQSYAFIMKHVWSDMFLFVPATVVKFFEGANDGLLAPRAVEWTNFRGIVTSASNRGISHCDEVDMRRRRLTRKQGEGISDITEFYINLVKELRSKGF